MSSVVVEEATERAAALRSTLASRVVISDGAMGTMIQASDATLDDFEGHEGCNEVLNATRPDVSKMSFEDALAELEQIVRALEGGQQKLEDAITAYERGAALRKHCEAKLAEAEARVAAIVRSADGSVTTRPME